MCLLCTTSCRRIDTIYNETDSAEQQCALASGFGWVEQERRTSVSRRIVRAKHRSVNSRKNKSEEVKKKNIEKSQIMMRLILSVSLVILASVFVDGSFVNPYPRYKVYHDSNDPGDALYLTKYIESGDVELVRYKNIYKF